MYEIIGPHNHASITKGWFTLLVILFIWASVWKLVALWKAARSGQLGWFVVIAILNTAGVLEIVYIFFLQKKQSAKDE